MKLFFVRHGETDWNVQKRIQGGTDTELNENGMKQAEELAEEIVRKNLEIAEIYTSKLQRAYMTAKIIGETINTEVVSLDGLEEINLGDWEGMRWMEVREKYPKEYQEWYDNRRYQRAPNGESYQDLLERVISALHKIMAKGQKTALVVTHSADIVTLLAMIHNTPFQDMFQVFKIGNAELVEIDSDEIHKIQLQ